MIRHTTILYVSQNKQSKTPSTPLPNSPRPPSVCQNSQGKIEASPEPQHNQSIPSSTMVVPLGPGKFYGSSLPRPRIYTDVKLNSERVDPPAPIMDPFLSWANEAHWSMGGLSFNRLRLQGRIEGNIKKLRADHEKFIKKETQMMARKASKESTSSGSSKKTDNSNKRTASASVSPPPAPIATKRRRFLALSDEEDDSEEEGGEEIERKGKGDFGRRLARKLGDDFDKVANGSGVNAPRTRSRGLEGDRVVVGADVMKVVEEANRSTPKGKKLKGKSVGETSPGGAVSRIRTSPRLAMRK